MVNAIHCTHDPLITDCGAYSSFCQTWVTITEGEIKEALPVDEADGSRGPQLASSVTSLSSISSSKASAAITLEDGLTDLHFLRRIRILEFPLVRSATSARATAIRPMPSEPKEPVACICGQTIQGDRTIKCKGCPQWYHASCVGLAGQIQPTAQWRCWICVPGEPDRIGMVATLASPQPGWYHSYRPIFSYTPDSETQTATEVMDINIVDHRAHAGPISLNITVTRQPSH